MKSSWNLWAVCVQARAVNPRADIQDTGYPSWQAGYHSRYVPASCKAVWGFGCVFPESAKRY